MNRLILLCGCYLILLSAGTAAAQTNTFPATGFVGIGTTSPAYPLDVSGPIAIKGIPVVDRTTISTPSDGTYVIASGSRIKGEYILSFEGSSKLQTVHLLVNAEQYNTAGTLQILESHSYWGAIMSNFQLLISADHTNLILTMQVGNRGGGTIANVQYQGDGLYGGNFGGTLVGTESVIGVLGLASVEGNVGIGTTTPAYTLDVAGKIHSSAGGVVFPDGTTQVTAFIPANCGADYAEAVDVSGDRTKYEVGDVLVIDPAAPGKFLKSNQAYSTLVSGVYSTKPGFVGRLQPANPATSASEVPMAMVGRVPTKVSAENGPIKVGDLLVSSSTVGYAMKGTDRNQMLGAVIGKALAPLDSGSGTIMVLVTLQ